MNSIGIHGFSDSVMREIDALVRKKFEARRAERFKPAAPIPLADIEEAHRIAVKEGVEAANAFLKSRRPANSSSVFGRTKASRGEIALELVVEALTARAATTKVNEHEQKKPKKRRANR